MADYMNFPKRWEDFLHDYEFEDSRRIYTNGSRLIPSFRVKQMMEHYFPADVEPIPTARWKYYKKQNIAVCTNCSFERDLDLNFGMAISCPNCGAKMYEEVAK